jgi:FixJ family two-component response regulator
VDDDSAVRTALSRLLRSAGWQVFAFANAETFLQMAEPGDAPACVVLDLCIPDVGGLDLQDMLVQAGQAMSVVFISGRADVPKSVRAMKNGAVDFLQKPVSEESLFPAVEKALRLDRERRAAATEEATLQARMATLSPRERQVFDLVVSGMLNKQAAAELGILEGTIKVHRARVMQKMAASSLADLVRMSERLGRTEIRA